MYHLLHTCMQQPVRNKPRETFITGSVVVLICFLIFTVNCSVAVLEPFLVHVTGYGW
jgi:hypothetical protein